MRCGWARTGRRRRGIRTGMRKNKMLKYIDRIANHSKENKPMDFQRSTCF